MRTAAPLHFLLALAATAGGVTFDRQWTWYLGAAGASVEQLADHGYIVGGRCVVGTSVYGVITVRTDSLGDTTAVRLLSPVDGNGGELSRTLDGGWVVTGTRDARYFFAVKYTAAGDSAWEYRSAARGYLSAVIPTPDTGCLIVGRLPEPATDFGAIKLSASGAEQWVRNYREPLMTESWARGADVTSDGGYILGGDCRDYLESYRRLVKIDANGAQTWKQVYFGSVEPTLVAVRQAPDRGFLALGYAVDETGLHYALQLTRTDSAGGELWSRLVTVPGASTRGAALERAGNGWIIAGTVDWGDSARVWLLRLDAAAETLWTRVLPGSGREQAADVKPALPDGFVVTGESDSVGGCVLLVKTDSLGGIRTAVREPYAVAGRQRLAVTPSPCRADAASVSWSLDFATGSTAVLSLLDVSGRVLRAQPLAPGSAGSATLDLRGINSGVYVVRLDWGAATACRKLVVDR